MRRRLALFLPAAVVALMLSGCVAFLIGSPDASQPGVIGSVEIESAICALDEDQNLHPGCTSADVEPNNGGETGDQSGELLAGYRVPVGSEGPASFTTDVSPQTLTFTRNESLTAELERVAPAGPDAHWVGYKSNRFDYDAEAIGADAHRAVISPEFTLPPTPAGTPYAGPFDYQVTIGSRRSADDIAATRPVVCADVPGQISEFADATYTQCISAPADDLLDTDLVLQTRDLALVAGAAATVVAGATADVPFVAKWAGPTPAAALPLTAATNIPGATATPQSAGLAPTGSGDTPLSVQVAVPAGTPAGSYDVTLTATGPGGEARSATQAVSVTKAPVAPPVVPPNAAPVAKASIVKGQTVRSILAKGLRVKVSMNEAGRTALTLRAKKRKIAAKTVRFAAAGKKTVTLKLTKKARAKKLRAKLLKGERLPLVLRSVATDRAGKSATTVKRFSLKRERS